MEEEKQLDYEEYLLESEQVPVKKCKYLIINKL